MTTHTKVQVPGYGELDLPVGLFMYVLPILAQWDLTRDYGCSSSHSDNEWVASSSKETFSTVNPASGEHLVDVAHATKDDVDSAVKAARKAFKTTWGLRIGGHERGALLLKLADLMERDQDKLAAVESLNAGKGIRVAK